jgi:phosphoenolpyruvate carboxykinase (ATP)
VDFDDTSFTENTRGAYPVEHVANARIPCLAGHPADAIFLTCDAFGVLPPVSRLSPAQAMYHFISGYTAKVAGTEVGVTEPQATFSPCFAGPFLAWHPGKYAELLAEKITRHHTNVWLVNTGWSGGGPGLGQRMDLTVTRAIVDAIHAGLLADAPVKRDPIFGLEMVTTCTGVPSEVLVPRNTWKDPAAYDATAAKLAGLFQASFKAYEAGVSKEVREAGPRKWAVASSE